MLNTSIDPLQTSRKTRVALWADALVVLLLIVALVAGIRIAMGFPGPILGRKILLDPWVLPLYSAFSILRLAASYALSLIFAFYFGLYASRSPRAEKVLIPFLDVMQSVPLLSFLPVVMLSFSAILPERIATELASIVLIFTCQAWNIAFCWHQSLVTLPNEFKELSRMMRFKPWLRFQVIELPFAAIKLVWNSMMSWANGWFFLMAAEIFSVGNKDFRLPGLGAYLQEAAIQGDKHAIAWGLGTLILVIVLLDQLIWRPMLVWVERYKYETISDNLQNQSWVYKVMRHTHFITWTQQRMIKPVISFLDRRYLEDDAEAPLKPRSKMRRKSLEALLVAVSIGGSLYFMVKGVQLLNHVTLHNWMQILAGLFFTFLRILVALGITLLWTIPLGYAIGSNRKVATWMQPIVQIAASVPATALFPVLVIMLLQLPGGLNLAAILLILLGTQWYMLFNIIGGSSVIPQDLRYTTALLKLPRKLKWKTLVLPALFPYIVTGAIMTTGGAWNACIVAEYLQLNGSTLKVNGIGSLIATASADGNFPLLLAATVSLIATVLIINRFVWRPLYDLAQTRFRWEQ